MQLSAPSPFPETILPAASGEMATDVAVDGEASADFAALFAGLTAPAQKPAPATNLPGAPKSKTTLDEAGLLAAFGAGPTVEVPPGPYPAKALPMDDLEGTNPVENETGEDALTDLATSEVVAPRHGTTLTVSAEPALVDRRSHATPAFGEHVAPRNLSAAFAAPPASPAAIAPRPTTPAVLTPGTPPVVSAEAPAHPAQPLTAAEAQRLAINGPAPGEAARLPKTGAARRSEGWGESVVTGAAKFAADSARTQEGLVVSNSAEEKNFLIVGDKLVAKAEQGLGTGVAIREPVMTTAAPSTPSPAFSPVGLGPKEGGIEFGTMGVLDAKVAVPEPIERMAHRAVEAVAATIERGASQPAHSVNLRFSVQGADLMVRVALRAEEVHVTFRTESSDLRNALAQEWQLVRSRDPDGVLHAVTPVFTAGDSGTATSQGGREGSGLSAQLQAQADAHSQRQAPRQPATAAPSPSLGGAPAPGASAVPSGRALSTEPTGAARLLHTFA